MVFLSLDLKTKNAGEIIAPQVHSIPPLCLSPSFFSKEYRPIFRLQVAVGQTKSPCGSSFLLNPSIIHGLRCTKYSVQDIIWAIETLL